VAEKLYIVGMRWIKSDPLKILDKFKAHLDSQPQIINWARLNVHVWLVKTNISSAQITLIIRQVIDPEDGVFVIAADLDDYYGVVPQLIWDWLRDNFHLNR
jgi:hypothetical protein